MGRRRLHRSLRGRKPRVLLFGAFVSFSGYLALAVLATHQHFFVFDYGVENAVRMLHWELLRLPLQMISMLGDHAGLIGLIALGFALLWHRSRRWAIALPVLMAGTGALQWLAKWAADRPRPNMAPWGFPSGHVLSLVVFFGLMAYLIVTASKRRRRWRVLACLVCAVTVLLVAFSRLYLAMHWMSDLAGGFAVGTAYLLLAIWVVEVVSVRPALATREAPPPDAREAGEEAATTS